MSNLFVIVTSVLSSGVIAAIIGFSFSEAKERWVHRRDKIEEIYLNASEWIKSASSQFLIGLSVCNGSLTYNQMLDLQLKSQDKADGIGLNLLRMKMNIYMYEHSLVSFYEEMDQERAKIAEINSSIRKSWEKYGQAYELFEPLNSQLAAFSVTCERFEKAIIARGIEIGAEKGQTAQAYEAFRSVISSILARIITATKQLWGRLSRRTGS